MRERKMAALFSASGRLATQKYSTLAFSTTLADSTSHRVHRVLLNEEYANLRMQHCWIPELRRLYPLQLRRKLPYSKSG
jgi:hypothetical protein